MGLQYMNDNEIRQVGLAKFDSDFSLIGPPYKQKPIHCFEKQIKAQKSHERSLENFPE